MMRPDEEDFENMAANPDDDLPEAEKPFAEADAPGRLIDELVDYVRSRRGEGDAEGGSLENEDLLRTVLRHLRRNPIPTALLGFSLTWLLLGGDEGDEEEEIIEPGVGYQLEEEIIQQARGGFAYTNARLRELVDRYPWAAAATMVGGGLIAALLAPERRRRARASYVESEIDGEPVEGDGFEFEEPENGAEYR